MTTGPRATYSSITRRVTAIRRSVAGRAYSPVTGCTSGVLIANASVRRAVNEGTRSSRACTSSTGMPNRAATSLTISLSSSAQPSSAATRAATSDPPDPNRREIVIVGIGPLSIDWSDSQMLDDLEPQGIPRPVGRFAIGDAVQPELVEPHAPGPRLGALQQRAQHATAARRRVDVNR